MLAETDTTTQIVYGPVTCICYVPGCSLHGQITAAKHSTCFVGARFCAADLFDLLSVCACSAVAASASVTKLQTLLLPLLRDHAE